MLVTGVTAADVVQLTVGAIMGTALAINMDKHGLSFTNPATRWKAIGLCASFLFLFVAITDLAMNTDVLKF